MKALRFDRSGDLDALQLKTVHSPEPGPVDTGRSDDVVFAMNGSA